MSLAKLCVYTVHMLLFVCSFDHKENGRDGNRYMENHTETSGMLMDTRKKVFLN